VSLEVSLDKESDPVMLNLARLNLAMEIASSALATWYFFDIMSRGQLGYLARWHYLEAKNRWRQRRDADRRFRMDLGRVIYEATRVLEEA
jgi:hypothetical protein